MSTNIREKLSNGLSRLFNNNGDIADKKRIRIIDGTPIHSTGLRRLCNDFQKVATLSCACAAAYIFNDHANAVNILTSTSLGFVAGQVLSDKMYSTIFDRKFGSSHKTRCINIAPEPGETSATTDIAAAKSVVALERKNLQKLFFLGSANLAVVLISKDPQFINTSLGTLSLVWSAHTVKNYYMFNKVVKGDWVIENTQDPVKKGNSTPLSPIPQPTG